MPLAQQRNFYENARWKIRIEVFEKTGRKDKRQNSLGEREDID
jgi:hypothetical protein